MPTDARASSTRAAASARSLLFANAARIRSWSVGSRKISHQGRSAIEAASFGCANRYSGGATVLGRSYLGANEHPAARAALTASSRFMLDLGRARLPLGAPAQARAAGSG